MGKVMRAGARRIRVTSIPSMSEKKKQGKKEEQQYEFCKACRLNHNQGRRHVYFPRHKSAISALLTRFQSKLADVRFFLKNPIPLRPEISEQNKFWCMFCDCEVLELDSEFACGNAIRHLASGEHWKKVKEFMWKNGAGMEQVDIYRIVDGDFQKWKKKLKVINNDKVKPNSAGAVLVGPLNNIHNEPNADIASSFHEANLEHHSVNIQNNALPLQINTNEKAQVSYPESSFVCETASAIDSMPGLVRERAAEFSNISAGGLYSHNYADSLVGHPSSGCKVFYGEATANGGGSALGFLPLTVIPHREDIIGGNVHTGAPPPWFDQTGEGDQPDIKQTTVAAHSIVSQLGKSSRLNPKRVGAAWAERRKLEIDLESRGELVANNYDTNWLPNFSGVWHSGTRKDSRKSSEWKPMDLLILISSHQNHHLYNPTLANESERVLKNDFIHCWKYKHEPHSETTVQGDSYVAAKHHFGM